VGVGDWPRAPPCGGVAWGGGGDGPQEPPCDCGAHRSHAIGDEIGEGDADVQPPAQ
jgi:hypothetical protein